jgi:hypothetical protein
MWKTYRPGLRAKDHQVPILRNRGRAEEETKCKPPLIEQ